MANSPTQMSPPPFSPNSNPMSPTSSNAYPPNKRPRLSPNQSPYGSPQMANGQLPNAAFSPQHDPNAPNGYPPAGSNETPSTPIGGAMGPPSRPIEEKAPGIDDLTDVLYGSGIDIREEESNLGRTTGPTRNASFTTQSTSFASDGSQRTYADAGPQYHYSANVPGRRDSFYGAGTFNQQPVSPDVVYNQAQEAKRARIQQYNQKKQFELNDPFLSGHAVWNKLQRETTLAQIKLTQSGGLPQQQNYRRDSYTLGGPQTDAVRPLGETAYRISSDGAAADALILISLAAKERVRMLLEDTGTIARGRRETALGVVPPELADMATGIGKPTDAVHEDSARVNPLKRSFSEANALPSPVSDDQSQPKRTKTIAFPNVVAASATKLQNSFKKLEEARAERRGKRKASGVLAGQQSVPGSTPGTPAPSTPAPGDVAPRISKKEQKKQADARANEAQQAAATSNAVNMALGGSILFGQKKKKISWMTSKQPSTDSFTPPKRQASSQQLGGGKGGIAPSRVLGNFREDKEDGKGIQLRDLVHILEPDMREKRTLARALNRLGSRR